VNILNVFPYIHFVSLCKMKWGHYCRFFFNVQIYICLQDAAYETLHLDNWFMTRRALNVFSYKCIRPCKTKHPLLGPFFMQILFLCATFTNHVPRMLYVKYQSIWIVILKFTKFFPFASFIGPQ